METLHVDLNQNIEGRIIATDIYNDLGCLLIPSGTVLNYHFIQKLIEVNVDRVKVYQQTKEEISKNLEAPTASMPQNTRHYEVLKSNYNEDLTDVKNLFHDLAGGQKITLTQINSLSDNIAGKVYENHDIMMCVTQIRAVDEYTYTHSMNVGLLAMLIAKWLKFDEKSQQMAFQAGLVHDLGKAKLPPELINKTEPLTPTEWALIKKHPLLGIELLADKNDIPSAIVDSILCHHERGDGQGYPQGLKDNQISIFPKIISVADVFDAMTSERSYKPRLTPFAAFKFFEEGGMAILDPIVLDVFLNHVPQYFVGENVRLSNDAIGEVVFINNHCHSRPMVKLPNNEIIDLYTRRDLQITEYIPSL